MSEDRNAVDGLQDGTGHVELRGGAYEACGRDIFGTGLRISRIVRNRADDVDCDACLPLGSVFYIAKENV